MKQAFFTLLLAFYPTFSSFAQGEAPAKKRLPDVVVQTGVGSQWLGEVHKIATLSIERPLGSFWRLGLQGGHYFKQNAGPLSVKVFLGGYDVGFYAKHFLHKRTSGLKSGFYLGPEIRFGQRRFQTVTESVQPFPLVYNYLTYKEHLLKFLLRCGMQWQFGHATLDLAAPIGVEFYQTTLKGYDLPKGTQVVLLPMVQLGIAL